MVKMMPNKEMPSFSATYDKNVLLHCTSLLIYFLIPLKAQKIEIYLIFTFEYLACWPTSPFLWTWKQGKLPLFSLQMSD